MSVASNLTAFSIVCCTRGRPADLCRLVASVIGARGLLPEIDLQLLIVDDGRLSEAVQRSLAEQAAGAGISWAYHNKRERSGLLRSRIEALTLAEHDWLLFVDDDVEVEPDYLRRLASIIRQNPDLAGVGGVDICAPAWPIRKIVGLCALGLEPFALGQLSWGGFPAGMGRLRGARRPFTSRRLYGCNMAFRKTALAGLRMLPGFEGYSLHEDAYLSFEAARHGRLLIDPGLRVRHHHSAASRDGRMAVGRMSVVNHHALMKLYGMGGWRQIGSLASVVGLIAVWASRGIRGAHAATAADFDVARGQIAGLKSLLTGQAGDGYANAGSQKAVAQQGMRSSPKTHR